MTNPALSESLDGDILDDVALEMLVERRGRTAQPLHLAFLRDLVPGDIERLNSASPQPVDIIKTLRYPHHLMARLIASGKSNTEVAGILGYSVDRVSLLKTRDPMFQELIAHYKEEIRQEYLDVHSRLATLGATSIELLQEKLEDTPTEQLTIKTLREVAEFALDRSSAPLKGVRGGQGGAAGIAVNVTFVAAKPQIEGEASPKAMIDITPQQQLEPPK